MKTITCTKAGDITKSVEDLTIIFTGDPATFEHLTLKELARYFDMQAHTIVDALMAHAPQGLTDRVLARLMAAKASLLIVPAPTETWHEAKNLEPHKFFDPIQREPYRSVKCLLCGICTAEVAIKEAIDDSTEG